MARARSFRRQFQGRRRQIDWVAPPAASLVSLASGAPAIALGGLSISEGALAKPTVVRVRGCAYVNHTAAATGIQQVGLGLILASDSEVVGTAIPGPLSDADDDRWMWHWCSFLRFRGASTDPQVGADLNKQIVIDSKAMRIWEENFQLVLVMENLPVSGAAAGIEGAGFWRALLKLA